MKETITSIDKLTLAVSGMRFSQEYEILSTDAGAQISLYNMRYTQDEDRRELAERVVCANEEMLRLFNDCGVLCWDGFSGAHPRGVLDGIQFRLTAFVNDGRRIDASGSENFPKNFRLFRNTLDEMLRGEYEPPQSEEQTEEPAEKPEEPADEPPKKKRRRIWFFLTLGVALAALLSFYLHFENTALQTTEYAVALDALPQGFEGFRIAQISDFHNARSQALGRNLREAMRDAQPDVLVVTGDLIDRRRTDTDTAIRLMQDVRDISPIFFVCGNHDALSAEYASLTERLQEIGVRVLANEEVGLKKDGDLLYLAGIDDPANMHVEAANEDIFQYEIGKIPRQPEQLTILLAHRPEALAIYAEANFSLVLAGHAHGGQIRLPFVGGLFAPGQGAFPKYTSGVYTLDGTQMVVSRGVGNSAFPFRIGNRPELVVVTLQSAAAQ